MAQLSCLIDGFGPLPLLQPKTVSELRDVVRAARTAGSAIYPVGGSTHLGMGLAPTKPGSAVAVGGLDQVIDYPARDMTITVEAGITIAKLQKILAPENQRLPIDVPCADRATLGGALAANASGPWRLGYGTLRDYLLGFSAVNDEGQEIKAGGRVVKNVAGYDLGKLFIGSLGTLGIITQATLKLRPLPEEQALIALACETAALEPMLEALHATRTRPVCLDLVNRQAAQRIYGEAKLAAPAAPWVVLVGYESNAEAVKWQVQQLIRELHGKCMLEARVGCTSNDLAGALAEFLGQVADDSSLTFKANLLPSGTGAFCRQAEALAERPLLQAHAGNGIVLGHAGPGLTKERSRALVQSLRDLARPLQGHVVVLCCPPSWKDSLFVWGPPREDAWLMRQVKEKLDPGRLFNPGRFVDGI